jgi:transmembrane sensor
LHAETEAHVRFSGVERRVDLVHGEAHFTVAKDAGRPFRVQAGNISVRAVGTAFNVRRTSDEVVVLVTQGRVRIDQLAAPEAEMPPTVSAGEQATVLVAETRAAAQARTVRVERVDAEAIREALAWQGPRLVFLETPLSQVVSEFNRHNRIQLVLGDDELGTITIGGSFRADSVDAFVRLIASDTGIAAEKVSPDKIVLRKAPLHPPDR